MFKYYLFICILLLFLIIPSTKSQYQVNCNELRMGQYLCPDPNINHIDPKTQQIRGCTKENKAKGK